MTVEHHDLAHDFPEYREKIHEMKQTDAHFAHLFDEYNKVEREVRRIEQEIETPSDAYVEELKKTRVKLKDELYTRLK